MDGGNFVLVQVAKMKWQKGNRVEMWTDCRDSYVRWKALGCLLLCLSIVCPCPAQASPDGADQPQAQHNQSSTLKTYDPGPPPRPVLKARPVTPADVTVGSNGQGEVTYTAATQQQAPPPIVPPPPPTDPPPPPVQQPLAPLYTPQAASSAPSSTVPATGHAPASMNPLEMKGPMDRPAAKPKTAAKPTPKPGQHTQVKPVPHKPAKPAVNGSAHPAGTLNPLDMPSPTHVVNPGQAAMGVAPQGATGQPQGAEDVLNMRDPAARPSAPVVYTPSPQLAAAQAQAATAQQTCAQAADYAGYINGLASNPEGMREGIDQMLQVLADQTTDPGRRSELQAAMGRGVPNDSVMQQLQNLTDAAQSICTAQTISAQKAMDAAQGVNSKGAPAPLAPPGSEYSAPAAAPQYQPQPY